MLEAFWTLARTYRRRSNISAQSKRGSSEPLLEPLRLSTGGISWIAGPTYVESIAQMLAIGESLSEMGAKYIRAKAYWPKAKEADFQRHLISGLKVLHSVAKQFDLKVVSEAIFARDAEIMAKYCDIIEVRGKRVFDTKLLCELAQTGKTILLHRHPMMSMEQFLGVVSYLESQGACDIILADNGQRSFDPLSRDLFDFSSIIALRRKTSYPILADCSRVGSDAAYAEHLAVTAVAAGADGILAELEEVRCLENAAQALLPMQLEAIVQRTRAIKCTLNALALQKYSDNSQH